MSGRRQLSTAQISQVIDETIWKEKIAHERKAKEYWDNIYRSELMKEALPVRVIFEDISTLFLHENYMMMT